MVDAAIYGEADVMEEKGLQVGCWLVGDEEVFSRSQEPEEGGYNEIDDGPVELFLLG